MKFERYVDNAGEHRSRIVADNGEDLFVSSEGYRDKRDLQHAIDLVRTDAPTAEIVDVEMGPSLGERIEAQGRGQGTTERSFG